MIQGLTPHPPTPFKSVRSVILAKMSPKKALRLWPRSLLLRTSGWILWLWRCCASPWFLVAIPSAICDTSRLASARRCAICEGSRLQEALDPDFCRVGRCPIPISEAPPVQIGRPSRRGKGGGKTCPTPGDPTRGSTDPARCHIGIVWLFFMRFAVKQSVVGGSPVGEHVLCFLSLQRLQCFLSLLSQWATSGARSLLTWVAGLRRRCRRWHLYAVLLKARGVWHNRGSISVVVKIRLTHGFQGYPRRGSKGTHTAAPAEVGDGVTSGLSVRPNPCIN